MCKLSKIIIVLLMFVTLISCDRMYEGYTITNKSDKVLAYRTFYIEDSNIDIEFTYKDDTQLYKIIQDNIDSLLKYEVSHFKQYGRVLYEINPGESIKTKLRTPYDYYFKEMKSKSAVKIYIFYEPSKIKKLYNKKKIMEGDIYKLVFVNAEYLEENNRTVIVD